MRFTASLANLVMKIWDRTRLKSIERAKMQYFMFLRYVDDIRLVLPMLKKGYHWNGSNFS